MKQSSTDNKRGAHLADAFDGFKSDFDILCIVGFPQPLISARQHTVCLLSLMMADSTLLTMPVFLSGCLPIRSAAGFPLRNLKIICDLSPWYIPVMFALFYLV